jgi:DNA-binding CsgD family transcriptional regulator
MLPQRRPVGESDSKTYPLGENSEHADASSAAIVALSHTPVEHRVYSAMLSLQNVTPTTHSFTVKHLVSLTGIGSLSTVRRALEGLLLKRSIDRNGNGEKGSDRVHVYRVFTPTEVITRRKDVGGSAMSPYVTVPSSIKGNPAFTNAVARVTENAKLSRREAQVALCCVEGLTNAEIGRRLEVSEQTVKFHLRHVFLKFGVKRRAELISRLLM